ncbi:flagellar assembly factor FliW [Clostridium aceticum]|uniref:Flagellar assembly factor FliW n=1 Tax=Clostridium aceticum TaxID=84022 RepID=A0A0D8I685_9CLOT|nr:flagellar assembly protein FliW [Clostridium aceticum]AKL93772.1 flagellar assembly factor FliW [Clostridium aceticum]KJF25810.1 flagellar assembly protein FliW [Clostridium aceticum]
MLLNTKHFGEIEIDENKILDFFDGIPGFENLTKFFIIQNPEEGVPFQWLQSVEDTDLAFVIVNPFIFRPDYDFEIPKNIVEKLEIQSREEVQVFTIVIVPEDIKKITANLRAPIIINTKNNKAKQIVVDDENYQTKHYILEEMKIFSNSPQQTPQAEEPPVVEGAR